LNGSPFSFRLAGVPSPIRIADDPDYQAASDEARGGPAEAVLNEVLRHLPLNVPSARRLLKKIPDRAGWLFSNTMEVFNSDTGAFSMTLHFDGTLVNGGTLNSLGEDETKVLSTAPEPASITLALIGAGLTGLAGWHQKRRKHAPT
jgi:hypothetical protein